MEKTKPCWVDIEEEVTYEYLNSQNYNINKIYHTVIKEIGISNVRSDDIIIKSYFLNDQNQIIVKINNPKNLKIFHIFFSYLTRSLVNKKYISLKNSSLAPSKTISKYNHSDNFYEKNGKLVNIYDEFNLIDIEFTNNFFYKQNLTVQFIFNGKNFFTSKFPSSFNLFVYEENVIFSTNTTILPYKYIKIRAKIPMLFEYCSYGIEWTLMIVGIIIFIFIFIAVFYFDLEEEGTFCTWINNRE